MLGFAQALGVDGTAGADHSGDLQRDCCVGGAVGAALWHQDCGPHPSRAAAHHGKP